MNKKQLLILTIIGLALVSWFVLDLGQYLQLETAQARIGDLQAWYTDNPLLAGAIYFAVYVAVTGLSVPGSTAAS